MKRPAIDLTAVCAVNAADIYASELSANFRAAVAAALPRGAEPSDDFWHELAAVVAAYVISQRNRTNRGPTVGEIERFKRIVKLATTPGKQHAELALIRILAEKQLAAHQEVREDFRRKQNMHNEALYFGILSLWNRELKRELGISRPRGPLVRFFNPCVVPPLGKPYTPSGVASIASRYKARSPREA
jgi:hypothetical protein